MWVVPVLEGITFWLRRATAHVTREQVIERVALVVVLKEMRESEYTCEEDLGFRMVTLVVFSKRVGSEDSRGTQELEAFHR